MTSNPSASLEHVAAQAFAATGTGSREELIISCISKCHLSTNLDSCLPEKLKFLNFTR